MLEPAGRISGDSPSLSPEIHGPHVAPVPGGTCVGTLLSGPDPGPHDMANSTNNTSMLLRWSTCSVPGPPCNDDLIQMIVITQEEGVVLIPILKMNKLRKDQRGEKTCSGPLTVARSQDSSPACPTAERVLLRTKLPAWQLAGSQQVWPRAAGVTEAGRKQQPL